MTSIDLNCDVGEGAGLEAQLLPLVTSANVACGAHAGDAVTMAETLRLAGLNNVVVGAHPGFADRANFGRVELPLSKSKLQRLLWEQLEALQKHGGFHYVKPHGALYNMAARDVAVAKTIVGAIKGFDDSLAEAAAEQVLEMVTNGRVRSVAETWVPLRSDSICLHGDNIKAVEFAHCLRSALTQAGLTLRSCWNTS